MIIVQIVKPKINYTTVIPTVLSYRGLCFLRDVVGSITRGSREGPLCCVCVGGSWVTDNHRCGFLLNISIVFILLMSHKHATSPTLRYEGVDQNYLILGECYAMQSQNWRNLYVHLTTKGKHNKKANLISSLFDK